MVRRVLLPVAAIAAVAFSSAARSKDYGEVAGWQLASSGASCGIYSDKAGNGEIVILKNSQGALHLQVTSRLWRVADVEGVTFHIDRDAWKGELGVQTVRGENGRGFVAAFGDGFDSKLRAGRRLIVRQGERALGTFSLSGSAAALNRLEFCLSDLERDGPELVMTAAAVAARQITPPQPTNDRSSWFKQSDYPRSAQKEGREGTVMFTLSVDSKGRVTGCRVTKSSGHLDIDASSCKAVQKRARFQPAMDGTGKKIAGSYNSRVTWRSPN